MTQYHEPADELSKESKDISRALTSLKEEIEAISWYNQRIDTAADSELKNVLAHNRDEEIEHACMAIEWLRRNMDAWDDNLRTYLFKDGDIIDLEANSEDDDNENVENFETGLGIRKIK